MGVDIQLASDSPREVRTREQLLRLLSRYDLDRWRFTDRIRIQDGVVPHSHPVLTLNTRHLDDDALLLATYLHEQVHWFLAPHKDRVDEAVTQLRDLYPEVPVGHPEGGSDSYSSYLHLVVCYLEYAALIGLLGPADARRVVEGWTSDHYTRIYAAVLRDFDQIGHVVAAHGLAPSMPGT